MSNVAKPNKKIRVSYFLPEAILSDVKETMMKEGYDLKGKSKWVSEAIHELLSFQNFRELVMINDQMEGLAKLDSISIEQDLKIKLDTMVIDIRKQFPSIEGVQSKILRTAIVQRLVR